MVWLRVLVYLVSTQKPLTYGEYRMLRLTHKELSKEGQMTVAPQTIERTLREWVTRREALHAAETGAGAKAANPMKSLGHHVHHTMDLSGNAAKAAAALPKVPAGTNRMMPPQSLQTYYNITGGAPMTMYGGVANGARGKDLPPLHG